MVIQKDQVEKRHRLSHHEVHEEHEGQVSKMNRPIFVCLMIFMVKIVFLGELGVLSEAPQRRDASTGGNSNTLLHYRYDRVLQLRERMLKVLIECLENKPLNP